MNSCDLDIYQGDDFAALVTVLNIADGTPADLTGYTAQAQIRSGPADQTFFAAAEITATVALPNLISLFLPSSATTLLRALTYFWDLQIVSAAGLTTTILAGNVNVTSEITREGVSVPWAIPTSSPRLLPAYPYPGPLVLLAPPAP